MMRFSRRGPSQRAEVAAFRAMDVMAAAARLEAEGRSVIRMEVGQPQDGAPEAARRALAEALRAPLGYTVALGLPALREAIAAWIARRYGVAVDPARVVVTAGSSAGFQLAFLSLFEAGDRLAMADPGYPSYRNIAHALGLEPVRLEATAETRFQPTPALYEAAAAEGPVAGLLAASPANPTGAMLDDAALGALITSVERAGGAFISDEIYHGLHYGAPAVTAAALSDEAIVINSFSKYFGMTGWRIGWMLAPERLVRTIEKLAQNLYICAPHASQIAALAALSDEAEAELEARRDVYARNRAVLIDALAGAGLDRIAPADGAFYVYADISALGVASDRWCERLLSEAGVAATPGWDFDTVRGGGWVRFSYAGAPEAIADGAERVAAHLRRG